VPKIDKTELRGWAEMLDSVACFHIGGSATGLKFSFDGREPFNDTELEARLKTADPQLAQRFRAWYDATKALGDYAHSRLEGKDG